MSAAALPNAGWPPAVLMRRFERSGRGELAAPEYRGAVAVLSHLANAVNDDHKSKSRDGVRITVHQLAARAGYSTKWVQTSLRYLEQLGLIVWYRGRIEGGKPRPSWITIQRARLVALVRDAMKLGDVRDRAHIEAIRDKIKALGSPRFLQSRRSSHVEAASTPHPLGGFRPAPTGRAKGEPRKARGPHQEGYALAGYEKYLPTECYPFGRDPRSCQHCKTQAYAVMKQAPLAMTREIPAPVDPAAHPGALFPVAVAFGRRP